MSSKSRDFPGKMHHVGFVVKSISAVIESFCLSIGGSGWSQILEDPIQRVRVAFISPERSGDPSTELVEPTGEDSPVQKFLERGGGLHHVCYEVDDLDAKLRAVAAQRLVVVRKPQPAVAFDGHRIAWVLTREKLLIEYLEAERRIVLANSFPSARP